MTIRKGIKSQKTPRYLGPVEIYTRRRIAEFDAAEAELGRFLLRKRLVRRPKLAKRGSR